ncbi:PREDICTED: uncharacterized protein LOC109341678 [Lupinus angustifolius]|uniref:uncharacterized protein LOC109341678 n=1 Tax=Lupinus angustifolius TaxID=3871 RepID=UPI00092F380A|nr:PREDICTED: uncharacterized protein LOC109341678 [Lupinus angustifolius]
MIGSWSMISLGRGFYDFSFSSVEDMRTVCAVGSWSLKPGFLRLSLWTPDFNPNLQKMSHSQCWVRILGLPLEYWSARILFSIAGGLGTPISLDEATTSRSFGHFSRILVDIDLKGSLPNQILVEREGFAFFVYIEYEKLPEFCSGCQSIGHLISQYRRTRKDQGVDALRPKKPDPTRNVPKTNPENETAPSIGSKRSNTQHMDSDPNKLGHLPNENLVNDLTINLEFDNCVNVPMDHLQSLEVSDSDESNDEGSKDTRVDDSMEPEANNVQLLSAEKFTVQSNDQIINPHAAKESRLVGRLWADEEEEDMPDRGDPITAEEGNYTKVLTKSQKKKLRRKQSLERVHFTRRGGYLNVSK